MIPGLEGDLDTLFFVLSKLLIFAIKVETWMLAGMVLSLWGILRNRRGLALGASTLTIAGLVVLSLTPIDSLLVRPLERAYPPVSDIAHVDGIIILGGGEDAGATLTWGQPQLNDAGDRLTAGAALALRHPDARVIFTGGDGRLGNGVDGEETTPVAAPVLRSLGVSAERITWENRSRNTAENAQYTFDLVQPDPAETWVLVTSAFHMGRAMNSFAQAGWTNLQPYPVDFRSQSLRGSLRWDLSSSVGTINLAVKEHVGRMVYTLTGR